MTFRWARAAVVLALPLAFSGCAALRMASMPEDLAASLQRQTDLELVRQGAPSMLLLLDGLADASPADPERQLAAANARVAYASAFLGKEEQERAAAMCAKARDYGLAVLSRNRAFRAVRERPPAEFESALPRFKASDVPALFVTAAAWTGWITSQPTSMEALADLPKVLALVNRVHELDPAYEHGGADLFLGVYYALQPAGGGRDLARSRAHFEAAFALAGPDYQPPRVAFAEYYARYAFDRDVFEKTLQDVVEHRTENPDFNLANEVARQRARDLLQRADDYF
jgi:hypothetical protein